MEVKPGYQQSEVGVIPEEWSLRGLGDVSDLDIGLSKPKIVFGSGCPVVTVQDLYAGSIINSSALKRVVVTEDEIQKYRLEKDDILIGNASVKRDGIGYSNRFDGSNEDVIFAKYAYRARNLRSISPLFLHHALRSSSCRQWVISNSQTGTLTNLNKTAARAIPIPVPPLPEQRAIATALSDVDGLLGGLDRLIAKKRDIKQAAMQQLLTGQTRLSGFHGEWEVKRLGDVATFYKGKGLPKSALSESGAEPCIHYGELFTRYPETIREIFSRTDTSEGVFRSVSNDVLMPTSDVTPRGLAKASCVRFDGVILGGDILVIRSDTNRVHGPFLSLVIRYEETQVLQLVTGSTVYHIYGSDMKNFTFSMPPQSEQTAIAEVLTEMDAELAVLEQRREKTRDLKQGMMQELLTGRIRLVGKN